MPEAGPRQVPASGMSSWSAGGGQLLGGVGLWGLPGAAQAGEGDEDRGEHGGDGERGEAPALGLGGDELPAEPRSEHGAEAADAGHPAHGGGAVVVAGAA